MGGKDSAQAVAGRKSWPALHDLGTSAILECGKSGLPPASRQYSQISHRFAGCIRPGGRPLPAPKPASRSRGDTEPATAGLQAAVDVCGRFRAGPFDAPLRDYSVPPRYGIRCRRKTGLRGKLRPYHRTRSACYRHSLELLSRGRRQFQSRESHHQHPLFRRRSAASRRPIVCLHSRRT